MNKKESELVTNLIQLVNDLKEENKQFKADVKTLVESMNTKVEKTTQPLNFEVDILRASQQAIQDSIQKVLGDYNSPLNKLVVSVIASNEKELKEIIKDSFDEVIKNPNFKESIINAFNHKVSKTIISNNDGLFDTVANELKKDIAFKIAMQTAVVNFVSEYNK